MDDDANHAPNSPRPALVAHNPGQNPNLKVCQWLFRVRGATQAPTQSLGSGLTVNDLRLKQTSSYWNSLQFKLPPAPAEDQTCQTWRSLSGKSRVLFFSGMNRTREVVGRTVAGETRMRLSGGFKVICTACHSNPPRLRFLVGGRLPGWPAYLKWPGPAARDAILRLVLCCGSILADPSPKRPSVIARAGTVTVSTAPSHPVTLRPGPQY
jgi:hypothetical protein